MRLPKPIYDYLRMWMLPLKEIDLSLPGKGQIVDLGCGDGPIANYLARVMTRQVLGIDNDKSRLPSSQQSNLKFIVGDLRSIKLHIVDGVVISDVLHHLSKSDQSSLLKKISKSLKKDKILIIKEIDTNDFFRCKLSRFWDFVFYPKDKIAFSNSTQMNEQLKKLGFKVKVKKASLFFPGSTTLYICTKK